MVHLNIRYVYYIAKDDYVDTLFGFLEI